MKARRTSLLVAFYLLTSAATAYAECAWVLWERREVLSPKENSVAWQIREAYESKASCLDGAERYVDVIARGSVELQGLGPREIVKAKSEHGGRRGVPGHADPHQASAEVPAGGRGPETAVLRS